jgi:hypothetical protein
LQYILSAFKILSKGGLIGQMKISKKLLITITIVVVIFAGMYILFQVYNLQLMEYIVHRTILEKLDKSIDPVQIHTRLEHIKKQYRTGHISKEVYQKGLLAAASHIEKVVILEQRDLDIIFGYLENGK